MTFKEAMIQEMTKRGMFHDSAEQVIDRYMETNQTPEMEGRWFEDTTYYPEVLVSILWMGVKEAAAEWIAEYAPLAWYRPMFQYTDRELLKKIADKNKHEVID